jgi:hypothetical protein
MLNLPVPVYSGKVANILDLVGARPWLCAGDSPGDIPMLSFSEHRLWIARLEKTGYQRELVSAAGRAGKENWLVQPALCKHGRGFIPDADTAVKAQPADPPSAVAASIEAIRKFLS